MRLCIQIQIRKLGSASVIRFSDPFLVSFRLAKNQAKYQLFCGLTLIKSLYGETGN